MVWAEARRVVGRMPAARTRPLIAADGSRDVACSDNFAWPLQGLDCTTVTLVELWHAARVDLRSLHIGNSSAPGLNDTAEGGAMWLKRYVPVNTTPGDRPRHYQHVMGPISQKKLPGNFLELVAGRSV